MTDMAASLIPRYWEVRQGAFLPGLLWVFTGRPSHWGGQAGRPRPRPTAAGRPRPRPTELTSPVLFTSNPLAIKTEALDLPS